MFGYYYLFIYLFILNSELISQMLHSTQLEMNFILEVKLGLTFHQIWSTNIPKYIKISRMLE